MHSMLTDFIFEYKEVIGFISLVVSLVVFFKQYSILWHPRYRYRVIICTGLFIAIISSWMGGWFSNTVCIAFLLLLAGFAFLMHRSSKKVLWPCSSLFSKIKLQINAGDDAAAEKMLSHCRWLCVDPLMRYEWNLLNAKAYFIRGDFRKAYEILRDFSELFLFEKEKDLLTVKKAGVLAQLGNYKGAATLTSGLKNVEGDLALQRAIVDALCQEVRGELATSSETLLSALLNTTETATNEFIPKIYNNLGRIRKIEGNTTETLLYYEKAANAAVEMGYKHLIHAPFQNLILSYALEKKFDIAEKWIEKYHAQINENNVTDLLEFDNLMLDYFRQKKDKEKLLSAIGRGRSLLYPKMTEHQKLVYDLSELRIRWNSQLLKPSYVAHIEHQLDKYLLLDLTERYRTLKEIHFVLERLEVMNALDPFLPFYGRVFHKLKEMRSEIEKHLLSLPEYCVNEKCYWLKELASLQKIDKKKYDFELVLQRLNNLKDTLLKNENYLGALTVGLDISDEAIFQKKNKIVWQSVQQTIKELERFKGHPVEAECFIRIAYYAFVVGQCQCAKVYLNRFEKTRVSPQHFADWIQAYYAHLVLKLNSNPKGDL